MLHRLKAQNLIDLADDKIVFPSGLIKLLTDGIAAMPASEQLPVREDDFQRRWTEQLDDGQRTLLRKAAVLGNDMTLAR